jgi:phage baseplate assembly protein W
MPDSVGIDRVTGKVLTDWAHVRQSIADILTTRILTRTMRREYGSDWPRLIDAPMNEQTLLLFYVAAAVAIDRWEPRFELLEIYFVDADASGRATLRLIGNYLPRGHKGDRTPSADPRLVLDLVQMSEGIFRVSL